jgi:hypothetical protein
MKLRGVTVKRLDNTVTVEMVPLAMMSGTWAINLWLFTTMTSGEVTELICTSSIEVKSSPSMNNAKGTPLTPVPGIGDTLVNTMDSCGSRI